MAIRADLVEWRSSTRDPRREGAFPESTDIVIVGGAAMHKTIGTVIVAAFCLAVVWLATTPAAYADDWDKATRITVNQPFEIPGMVLPAGTYIIKIVDLAAERHVVRILSGDESKIYATLIGIPDFRLEPTDKTA